MGKARRMVAVASLRIFLPNKVGEDKQGVDRGSFKNQTKCLKCNDPVFRNRVMGANHCRRISYTSHLCTKATILCFGAAI
jgi:hypothetical protein